MAKHNDLTGQKFGRLTVLREAGHPRSGIYLWECVCDCEAHTHIILEGGKLKSGNTKSCGCLNREKIIKRNKENALYHPKNQKIFGRWVGMKDRCYNPNHKKFQYYGGKGIRICDEWLNNYSAFEDWSLNNGFSDELTIDRIDSDKDYSPDNCRWVTWEVQHNNTSRNKYLTYKGRTQSLSDWCKELGLNYGRTKARLNACHWTVEEAFESGKYEQVNLGKQKD